MAVASTHHCEASVLVLGHFLDIFSCILVQHAR